jgi:hypothetical protein
MARTSYRSRHDTPLSHTPTSRHHLGRWSRLHPGTRAGTCARSTHEAAAQHTTCVVCNATSQRDDAAITSPHTRPMTAMARHVSEVWWIRGSETPTIYAKATGCDPWDNHHIQEVYIHRDPEVKREGNDVTQAAFQSDGTPG